MTEDIYCHYPLHRPERPPPETKKDHATVTER